MKAPETSLPGREPGPAPPPAPLRRKSSPALLIACALWLAVVGAGTIAMTRYASLPGGSGQAPLAWPGESTIPFDASRPTLVMFVHPRCPCTRASLGELEVLLARFPARISAVVVVLKPVGTVTNWEKTDLWRKAATIPGVTVCTDPAGIEARRFHSETSGQTVLYDRDGSLRFQGGITLSRGHAGDNPGRRAVEELLRTGRAGRLQSPVFGCALFETKCQEGITPCKP